MRTIDPSTRLNRRSLMRGGATLLPAAALASVGVTISATDVLAADATAVTAHTMATLVKMARDIYPHDKIADSFYITAAKPWDTKAGTDPAFKTMLTEGVQAVDLDAKKKFGTDYLNTGWEEDRLVVLRAIEQTPFFQKLRGDLVVSLYNQPAIWPKFGYEGSSAEHGGYIARGFDDIDWLPV